MPHWDTIAVHHTNYMEQTSTVQAKCRASYFKRDVTYNAANDVIRTVQTMRCGRVGGRAGWGPKVHSSTNGCGFFWTGLRSSHTRQHYGSLLRDLGVTSLIRGPPAGIYATVVTTILLTLWRPTTTNSGRTAPLASKRCILYIYSTNIGTEYLKHGIYSPFFSLQNAVCLIILTYLVPVLFTFYIQGVLKLKK